MFNKKALIPFSIFALIIAIIYVYATWINNKNEIIPDQNYYKIQQDNVLKTAQQEIEEIRKNIEIAQTTVRRETQTYAVQKLAEVKEMPPDSVAIRLNDKLHKFRERKR